MPRCGVFNACFAGAVSGCKIQDAEQYAVDVLVPVPEWKFWKHRRIRRWTPPDEVFSLFSSEVSIHYVPVFYIPVIGRTVSWLFYKSAFWRRRDLFDRCDVVLGSWLYPDCAAAAAVAEACGKLFYARLHGTDRFHLDAYLRGAVCRRSLNTAKCIFVNARFMSEELKRRGIAEDKICVVRNGVNRNLFYPRDSAEIAAATAEFGAGVLPDTDVFTFLWVGNLVEIKAPDLALKAFAALPSEGAAAFKLFIAGSGPLRMTLEKSASNLGIDKSVVFCGSLPHNDIALLMNRADCLLLTSRSEGMPNVVVEALASGIPVVATNVGDVSCVVGNDSNGYVVEGGDRVVSDLADAMRKSAERSWDSEGICNSVVDFDWGRSADRLLRKVSE